MSTREHAPQPRATVAAIPAYVAGKPPAPRPGQQVYKLSSNENPYPPLPGRGRGGRGGRGADEPLPRHGQHRAVRRPGRAARRTSRRGSPPAPARWRCSTTCSRRSASPATRSSTPGGPSRPTRSRSRRPARARCRCRSTADGRHDLDAMAAAVTDRTKVVIVCTPNNPTGPSVTDTELRAFVEQVPEHVLVVVDEAYREFVRAEDPVDALALPGRARQRRGDAHLRQGLRAGRASGSATSSRTTRWPRPCAPARCRSASPASPRPPPWRASPPRRS